MRPLSLLLVPGMPPSFLTPSPCDVDMTYCERAPVLTLTAPPNTSPTADVHSPPDCRTGPPPQTPPAPGQRQESGRSRTWRRGGEKKPGSSRRVRPEPTAKVSSWDGDGGSDGTERDEGSGETPPVSCTGLQDPGECGTCPDGESPPVIDTEIQDRGECESDLDGEQSPVVGTDQGDCNPPSVEEGLCETGRDGEPLPESPDGGVTNCGVCNKTSEDGEPPRPGSLRRDVTDCDGDCEVDGVGQSLTPGRPIRSGTDHVNGRPPPAVAIGQWDRENDGNRTALPEPPSSPGKNSTEHEGCELQSVADADELVSEVGRAGKMPPLSSDGESTDNKNYKTDWECNLPEAPSSPTGGVVGYESSNPLPVTNTYQMDGDGDQTDWDGNRPPSSPETDSTDHRTCQTSPITNTNQRIYHKVDLDGNPPLQLSSSDLNSTGPERCKTADQGKPPLITVTEHRDDSGDGDGDGNGGGDGNSDGEGDGGGDVEGDSSPERPPSPDRDITDGDRVRIELRLDGVTVVSGRETRL